MSDEEKAWTTRLLTPNFPADRSSGTAELLHRVRGTDITENFGPMPTGVALALATMLNIRLGILETGPNALERIERKLDWISWKLRGEKTQRILEQGLEAGLFGPKEYAREALKEVRVWPGDLPEKPE